MTISIYLLGQPRLLHNAQPIQFNAPPKTLPLLAYLLLHRHHAIARQQIAFALWPDDAEADARSNLRRHLHQLQHALPPAAPERPWLLLDAASVRWNPQADFWLDVAEFENLAANPDRLADAVQLYEGELLENIYDDWVFFERERLHEIYFASLRQLVFQHRTQRNYGMAIAFAQQILVRDPCREDILRQLVSIRYEAGDRAGALQEYEAFVRRLRQEMGVDPMPETQTLHELVLRNARLPGASTTPEADDSLAPGNSPSQQFMPFVGRSAEMAQLAARWNRAAHGHGGLVLLGGETGVGKTRLGGELALLAEQQGGRVLYGSTPPGEPRPYLAIVEALQSALPLLVALKDEPLRLAALAGLLPELHARCALPRLPALEPEKERIRLFDAVSGVLEKLSGPRPLLLILEDLHWAGESTLALIEFMTRRAANLPLLLLGSYREEEIARHHPLRAMRRRLQAEKLIEHQALRRLNRQAVDTLFEQLAPEMLPAGVAATEVAARLHNVSEGNPLFLSLLLQHWQKVGFPGNAALPQSIQAAVAQRLAHLSPLARSYAEVAAVLGATFDFEASREIGGWRECQALDALSELLDHQLVRDTAANTDYCFIHHLIQSGLYAQIPAAKRRRRHLRAAEVLEKLYPERGDELAGTLAFHYDCAGAGEQAIPHYLKAAHNHLAVFADSEALATIEHALHLAEHSSLSTTPHTLVDLLLLREAIYHRRGERGHQQADLSHLEQLAETLGDARLICEIRLRHIAYHSVLGERQAEAEKIQQLKALAQSLGDSSWLARAYAAEGHYLTLINTYPAARASLEQALSLYQAAGDVAGQIACACAQVNIAVELGDFTEAQALLQRAESQAQGCANPSTLVQVMRTVSGAMLTRQDFNGAEGVGRRMLEFCRTIGDRDGEADALVRLAAVAARLFRISEAGDDYVQAEQIYSAIGKRQGQAAVMVNRCMLLIGRLGLYEEGLGLIRRAEKIFRLLGDVRGKMICAINESLIASYLGDNDAAYRAARRGLEAARQMNSRAMEASALANLGAAARELGKLDEATQHMEAGLEIRRKLGLPADLGSDLCDLTVAYCRKGDLVAARRSADEMLALYEREPGAMLHSQYILWAAAQVHHCLGEHQQANEFLEQAYKTLLQLSANMFPDDPAENSYLRLPFNRQIIAACERGEWP